MHEYVRETLSFKLLTLVLYATFLLGAILIVTLPFLMDTYMRFFYGSNSLHIEYRVFITAFLMVVGALGEWIVVDVIRMMRTIPTGPFVQQNTLALRRTGIIALIMAGLFFAKCFVYLTFLTLAFGLLLIVSSLVAFTLSGLFRQAVAYREENDLTI